VDFRRLEDRDDLSSIGRTLEQGTEDVAKSCGVALDYVAEITLKLPKET